MSSLPDMEAWAIFAKVVEARSFARAAADLGVSKATVSKAVSRLEGRLGARLFNRTSRRLSLTDAGRQLSERASRILAEAEAAENEALEQSATPRGQVRFAAPMSFGLAYVAPALPEFLAEYPAVTIDLHLGDELVDLIGGGFDAALRISPLPESSLIARRLCEIQRIVVAAPVYLEQRGTPKHPGELADHACLAYTNLPAPGLWRFKNARGEEVAIRPAGPLRANNGDALMAALLAGHGIAVLPDFIVAQGIAEGRLVALLPDWISPQGALHLLMPPGGPRPAKVDVFSKFLIKYFSRPRWPKAPPGDTKP